MPDPSPTATAPTSPSGRLVLVRHGRTEWARTGQHTGRTDVPLDEVGTAQARALPALLAHVLGGRAPSLVLSSPLSRALRTAQLAGLGSATEILTDDRLLEWDYGAYEGLTTPAIRQLRGDFWRAFADGMAPGGPGQSPGESLQDVAARAAGVLTRIRAHWAALNSTEDATEDSPQGPSSPSRDVVCVGHGHALRILATVWLGLPPASGAALLLDPASVCVLDTEHGVPGIRHWNLSPAVLDLTTR